MGACAEAGVRKVVLKSSTAVYGARPSNSAFLTEDHSHRGSKRYGYVRDLLQMEAFCSGFCRRVPEMAMLTLRFANIVGPTADTPMNRFLKDPWAPGLLGFDPLMQLIHEDDVVEALVHALLHDVQGPFNVAAEGVLPLNKVRGLANKPFRSVLHPFAYWGLGMPGHRLGIRRRMPLDPDYLRYPCVADLTRMREKLGFEPRYLAEEALLELAEQKRLRQYLPQSTVLAQSEERLRAIIEHRRRGREWRAAMGTYPGMKHSPEMEPRLRTGGQHDAEPGHDATASAEQGGGDE
jgi:UDP-glucose 4-epimerase